MQKLIRSLKTTNAGRVNGRHNKFFMELYRKNRQQVVIGTGTRHRVLTDHTVASSQRCTVKKLITGGPEIEKDQIYVFKIQKN